MSDTRARRVMPSDAEPSGSKREQPIRSSGEHHREHHQTANPQLSGNLNPPSSQHQLTEQRYATDAHGHSHHGHHGHHGHAHPDFGKDGFYTYQAEVRRVLLLTLVLNVLVVILKAGVGWWTGSLSLMADALHSITDSANNVLGLVTNQLASPEPDRDHPYGHQKFEAVGALGIAAFLGIACFEILRGAAERIIEGGEPVSMSVISLWIMLAVLGVNIFVAFYERRVGTRLGSNILIADAYHTMSDIWITIAVLGGLIGVWLGAQWLDVVLAFPVALLVIRSGWVVLSANLPWLVDEMAIAPEAIHAVVMQVPGVLNCHNIASRGLLGRQVFIDMHLIVEPKDVVAAHLITEQVEQHIEDEFGPSRVTIHVEPPSYVEPQISFGPGHHKHRS